MSQSSMSPVRIVSCNASAFITGSAPGSPRQVGQVCEFGAAPNSTWQPQNILERVRSWAWTSKPIVVKYAMSEFRIADTGNRKGLLATPGCLDRRDDDREDLISFVHQVCNCREFYRPGIDQHFDPIDGFVALLLDGSHL